MLKLPIKCLKLIFDTQNLLFCDEKCSRNMFLEFFFQKFFWTPPHRENRQKNGKKLKNANFLTLNQ